MAPLQEIGETLEAYGSSFTKQDLASIYEISLEEVSKTIRDCGVKFDNDQCTLEEAEKFHAGRVELEQGEQPNAYDYSEAQGRESLASLDAAVFAVVNEAVAGSVDKMAQVIPALTRMHVARVLMSPEVQKNIVEATAQGDGDLNLFFLRGLKKTGLLPPSLQQQALSPGQSDN